jgi:hypothetical protein
MNFLSSDKNFLLLVLQEVQAKATNLKSSSELCSLAESVAVLKEGLKPGKAGDSSKSSLPESLPESKVASEVTETSAEEPLDQQASSTAEKMSTVDEVLIEKELHQSCESILESIASQAIAMVGCLSTDEIGRLLAVYSLLPFQNDALINGILEEITKRKSHLQQTRSGSFENILLRARSSALSVNTTVFGDKNSESPLNHIKNGIMSFFSSSENADSGETKDENSLTEELTTSIQESAATTSKAAKSVEDLHLASGISIDSVFQNLRRGTAFELGRCSELIENYRRIEFSTGTLRSRYDKETRNEIAKRVLSRLLP